MKHAGPQAFKKLAALLQTLRGYTALNEKSRGTFYLGSRAVLHFHEDPAGLFADVRTSGDWERFPVNTRQEQKMLQQHLGQWLTALPAGSAARPARPVRAGADCPTGH